jgi:hypothetical protein
MENFPFVPRVDDSVVNTRLGFERRHTDLMSDPFLQLAHNDIAISQKDEGLTEER